MRKPLRLSILAAAVAASALFVMAPSALAVTNFDNAPSGAHYRNGFGEPVCTTTTNQSTGAITVSCGSTSIGGVGNTNANLLLEVSATSNFVCRNPGSKRNIVEPHSGSVSDSAQATLTPSKNGQLAVGSRSVTITPQEAAEQFECPNPNWTEQFVGFTGPSFTYSLTFVGFGQPAILIEG